MFRAFDDAIVRIAPWISVMIPVATVIGFIIGCLKGLDPIILLLSIGLLFLILIIFLCLNIHRELVSPRNTKLIQPFEHEEIYIFFQGRWKHIPDPDTLLYLAAIFGFDATKDIQRICEKDFQKYRKGDPLQSIRSYVNESNLNISGAK